jgi:hypothetical protein
MATFFKSGHRGPGENPRPNVPFGTGGELTHLKFRKLPRQNARLDEYSDRNLSGWHYPRPTGGSRAGLPE